MLTQNWFARQCAISVPHSSMSGREERDNGPAEPRLLGRSPPRPRACLLSPRSHCGPHRCSGARAAPSPSCSEGNWSPPALCSARTPGSTLQAGESGHGCRQGGAACTQCQGSTRADPWLRSPPSLPGRTPTYQHIPGGSCSVRPRSNHHRTRHRRGHHSLDCRRTGQCRGVCHHHRIARCRCRAAGARRRRLCRGRSAGWQPAQEAAWAGDPSSPGSTASTPPAPDQHPAHAIATHAGSRGHRCQVGSRAPACPCTAIGRSRGAAAAWGGGRHGAQPPAIHLSPHVPIPRLTRGTTTAPRAPHSAPAAGGR